MDDSIRNNSQGRTELRDRRIEGSLDWTHDPFFRPLIGIYAGGRLTCIIPTLWRAYGENSIWRCYFSQELPEDLETENITAICLENGELLYPPREARVAEPGAPMSVEDIVDAGRRRVRAFDYGGFESFLMLPLFDQLAILYQDFLGHFPTQAESILTLRGFNRATLAFSMHAMKSPPARKPKIDMIICRATNAVVAGACGEA